VNLRLCERPVAVFGEEPEDPMRLSARLEIEDRRGLIVEAVNVDGYV